MVMQQFSSSAGNVVALKPVDLGLSVMKELRVKWIEEVANHISENPQFIVRGKSYFNRKILSYKSYF